RDLVARRLGWVATPRDELARGRPGLIRVDLVPDQQHRVGPGLARLAGEPVGQRGHRVRPVLALAAVTGPAPPRRQLGDPARPDQQPPRPARVQRAEHAGPEDRTWLGPADGLVQRNLIGVLGARPQAGEDHKPVVMPGYLEGPGGVPENLDLTGP